MKLTLATLLLAGAAAPFAALVGPSASPASPGPTGPAGPIEPAAPAAAPAPVHCQVPCGIYGDSMRIAMQYEDAATIEKGMKMIRELEASSEPSANQLVRWIMNKDEHAAAIQERVASYWLAQRIKAPKPGSEGEGAAREKYQRQLELLHGITVAAMKCKQTTELEHVESLRSLALAFSETYFTGDDLKHIREHHGEPGGEHR